MPPHALFDTATTIRGAGLSLNIICQQYADGRLQRLLAAGTSMRCLFLDPSGEAIRAREREEGHPTGFLAALTEMNINHLRGIRERLPTEDRERLRFAVYDETIRFHLIFVDDALCVAQPYLPLTRGVDSPTFVIERQAANSGLYPVFDRIFDSMWESGREL